MADYTVTLSKHATLIATTVDSVTITEKRFDAVEVTNRDGAAEIYYTIDGSTPAVGADNTWVLPAAVSSRVHDAAGDGNVKVELISAGTPKYSVSKVPQS